MKKPCLTGVSACLIACLLGSHGSALAREAPAPAHSVAICDDENEWPPYSYYLRAGDKKTAEVTGYAVSVLHEIFSRRGVTYSIELIPWPRCLAVSIIGKQYGMVLNMTYNAERAKSFLFSRPYYSTTSYYYYSRHNYPGGLAVASAADIRKHRVCGIQGYNYEGYGMAPGEVDQGAKNFVALINKVKLGRCALFMEKDEVMTGYAAIGKHYLADPDLGKAPIPGLKPSQFYFGISKRHAQAEELRKLIDEELLHMEASGRLVELWKKAGAQARR